jgi:hypothetical protein
LRLIALSALWCSLHGGLDTVHYRVQFFTASFETLRVALGSVLDYFEEVGDALYLFFQLVVTLVLGAQINISPVRVVDSFEHHTDGRRVEAHLLRYFHTVVTAFVVEVDNARRYCSRATAAHYDLRIDVLDLDIELRVFLCLLALNQTAKSRL